MSNAINYRQKYMELRLKLIESVDVAYRLGYEEGMKDAQIENMQQEKAEIQQEQAAMQQPMIEEGGAPPIDEGTEGGPTPTQVALPEDQEDDELGGAMNELEGEIQ